MPDLSYHATFERALRNESLDTGRCPECHAGDGQHWRFPTRCPLDTVELTDFERSVIAVNNNATQ
jgi:hypothetical protein